MKKVKCRVGEEVFTAEPGELFFLGGGAFFWGYHPAKDVPPEWEGDIVGGAIAVPITPPDN